MISETIRRTVGPLVTSVVADGGATDAQITAAMVAHGLADDPMDAFVRGYELPRVRAVHSALRSHLVTLRPRVLDVGFLDGRVPFILRHLDAALDLVCTERDQEAVSRASRRAGVLVPDVVVHVLDLTDISEPQNSYDAVILGEVLEHISVEHLPNILSGLRTILRDEGIIIVTTPNLHGLAPRVRHALGADFLHDPVHHREMGLPHVNLLSARMLCDLARSAGLEVAGVDLNDFTSGMRARRSTRARILQAFRAATLSRLVPSTRDDLLVVLRRSAVVRPPSGVFSRTDVSLREALRATRGLAASPAPSRSRAGAAGASCANARPASHSERGE